jgi:hypothetical protein
MSVLPGIEIVIPFFAEPLRITRIVSDYTGTLVVTDAVRRQIVFGDEGTKTLPRSGTVFEGLGSRADHVDELGEGGVGIGRKHRSGVLLLGMHIGDCGQHGSDRDQNPGERLSAHRVYLTSI